MLHPFGIALPLIFALELLAAGTATSASATYDLVRDYSPNLNPNGVWSYGWKSALDGPLTVFARHGFEANDRGGGPFDYWLKPSGGPAALYHNPTSTAVTNNNGQGIFPPGAVWIGPGYDGAADNFCVVRFTLPAGAEGAYQLDSTVHTVMKGLASGDSDFHVLRNGSEIFGVQIAPSSGTQFNQKISLAAGDTIDFAVGRGADGREYASALKIEATLSRTDFLSPRMPRNLPSWALALLFFIFFVITAVVLLTFIAWQRKRRRMVPPTDGGEKDRTGGPNRI